MTYDERILQEMECTIKQAEAVNYVLRRTYDALVRYDPTKNAAEPRDDSAETHEHEFLSPCCGASPMADFPLLCRKCHDHNGFECDCGEVAL